jgi:hypothetical protein
MIEHIHRGARIACASVALLLAACGGGGGGGGGGGQDLSTAPGITVSPTSLSFVAIHNGALPPTQAVQITISAPNAAFVGLAVPAANPPTWLDYQNQGRLTGSGNNWTFTAAILNTSLAPGTYTTTVQIGIADAGQNILAYRNVSVSYTVQPLAGFGANPTSVSFSQLQGAGTPSSQTLGITELGGASYAWNASIVYQSGSGWLTVNGANSASGATLPTSLTVGVNSSPALGTLNALVRVTGNGNTLDIPVSYTVTEPALTRSPASLTFNASRQGASPATQDVTLTTQGSLPLNYTTSVTYGGSTSGWLTVPANGTAPGTVTVGVNTTNLVQGTYTATVFVNTAAQTVSIGITYIVAAPSLTFNPASTSFTITTASLPAALSQTVSVGSTGAALLWSATSSQSWVSVSPTSALSGAPVTLNIVSAELDTLDPGTHSATINFSYTPPGGSLTTAPLSVSLDLQIPKVTSVNPYVATSGTNLEVILRGLGFNNTANSPVKFDSNSVSSYTVASDTELRVTHPLLTAGTYRVSIANQLANPGIVRSTADLVVVDAPAFPAATIAYPDVDTKTPVNIVYDGERQALLVGVGLPTPGAQNGRIYRYTFSGSAWSVTPATTAVSAFRDLALSLDGKKLIAISDAAVSQFNASTLATGTSTNATLLPLRFLNGVVVANDDTAIVTTGINGSGFTEAFRYSIADGALTQITGIIGFSDAGSGASADGSRGLFVQGGVSPAQPVFQYNASTGTVSATNLTSGFPFPRPVLDRRAASVLIGGTSVYDSSLVLLGTIPTAFVVALSPDGKRAYGYSNGTVLHAYDLVAPPVAGVFQEILPATTLLSDPGLGSKMTVSPDGGNVFIAGDLGIVVVPAP